jgi:hypothetical protein
MGREGSVSTLVIAASEHGCENGLRPRFFVLPVSSSATDGFKNGKVEFGNS